MTSSPTDTPKRLSAVELAEVGARHDFVIGKITRNEKTGWGCWDLDAHNDRSALLSHIAALTAPPSQGKVEISEDGICWTCKCGWRSTFLDLKCPGCGNGQPAIYAAITQALTESSGQGTDGADAEFMRIAVTDAMTRARQQNWKNGGVHLYDVDELIESLLRDIDRIRSDALPLPVSADGARDAVIEECAKIANAETY